MSDDCVMAEVDAEKRCAACDLLKPDTERCDDCGALFCESCDAKAHECIDPQHPECSICRQRHPSDDRHACE